MSDRDSKLATREAIVALRQVRSELDRLEAENRQQDRLTLGRVFIYAAALVGGLFLVASIVFKSDERPVTPKAPTSTEQGAPALSEFKSAEPQSEEQRQRDAFAESISQRLGKSMTISDYPAEARANGWGGSAVFRLAFNAAGELESVTVAHSTGHAMLDDVAVRKLREVKMPPIPAALKSKPIEIDLPVMFAVRTKPQQ
jgi:TonB family protein